MSEHPDAMHHDVKWYWPAARQSQTKGLLLGVADKPANRREEEKTQTAQPIPFHLFTERNLAEHSD